MAFRIRECACLMLCQHTHGQAHTCVRCGSELDVSQTSGRPPRAAVGMHARRGRNVRALRSVLLTYAMYNFDLGYVQVVLERSPTTQHDMVSTCSMPSLLCRALAPSWHVPAFRTLLLLCACQVACITPVVVGVARSAAQTGKEPILAAGHERPGGAAAVRDARRGGGLLVLRLPHGAHGGAPD